MSDSIPIPQPPILPDSFQFSASSLQDFVDCPARFYLRCIRQRHSPAPASQPLRDFEEHAERGTEFHRLVYQHGIGIPPDALEATITDDAVESWWRAFLANPPAGMPADQHHEVILSAPLAGRRLVARYDLIAVGGGRAVIADWKTTLRRPSRDSLQRRLQTIVYPYLLARAGAHLNGGSPIPPEAITMIYWFPEFPDQPEIFTYDADSDAKAAAYLEALAADILRRDAFAFDLTDDLDRCQFCEYRALHERGRAAGNLLATGDDAADHLVDFDLSLEQIAELAF